MPEAHVHSVSIFDCDRIYVVRDQEGTLTLYVGSMRLDVRGHYPFTTRPELVEVASQADAQRLATDDAVAAMMLDRQRNKTMQDEMA